MARDRVVDATDPSREAAVQPKLRVHGDFRQIHRTLTAAPADELEARAIPDVRRSIAG